MLRVLFVGADDIPGGISIYVKQLYQYCNSKEFEFHMTVSGNFTRYETENDPNRICKRHLFPKINSNLLFPSQIRRLRSIIKKNRIDLIHLHAARAGIIGALASLGTGVGVLYTGHSWRHEVNLEPIQKFIFYWIERLICFRSDKVTFLTKRDLEVGIQKMLLPRNKAELILTRIDPKKFRDWSSEAVANRKRALGIPSDAWVVGNIASIYDLKDPFTFLRAAQRIAQVHSNIFFLWVGDGIQRADFESFAKNLGIQSRVILTGEVPPSEIPELIHMMDVFLITSVIECVPFCVIEAQAAGIPVVSSNYRWGQGIGELLVHEQNSFIFQPGDDQRAAEYVLRVLFNPEVKRAIVTESNNSFNRDRSGADRMARDFERAYWSTTQKKISPEISI